MIAGREMREFQVSARSRAVVFGRGYLFFLMIGGLVALTAKPSSATPITIAGYNFDDGTKTASTLAQNVTASSFDDSLATANSVANAGAGGSGKAIKVGGWQTSGNYFYFTITPAANHELNLASLQFADKGDNPGPGKTFTWTVSYRIGSTGSYSSIGNGSVHTSWTADSPLNLSTLTALQGVTNPITFHIQASTNSDNNKKWSVDGVAVTGEVLLVPDPSILCLLVFGIGLLKRRCN